MCHMGKYVNPDNKAFHRIVKTGKYVDKSGISDKSDKLIVLSAIPFTINKKCKSVLESKLIITF